MSDPRSVLVLGAGPAGLGAAVQLARRRVPVTVLERSSLPGGNSGSFDLAGMKVDYGSHRLHPSSGADILGDIRGMLGGDLLDRPRHGRIRPEGQWLRFPLRAPDLIVNAPSSFAAGFAIDALTKPFRTGTVADSFAGVLLKGLGPAICRSFYFPYARKIWGMDPEALDAEQARRRVSAGSPGKLVMKILGLIPGFRKAGAGRFFYPRQGFGQISEAYLSEARQQGARVLFDSAVESVENAPTDVRVKSAAGDHEAAMLFSTIPVTALVRLYSQAPPVVLNAAAHLRYRAMVLIYLVLGMTRYTEFDAHYFPGESIAAAACWEDEGTFNRERWNAHRRAFEEFVVEG